METITLNDESVVNGHILDGGDGRTIFVYLDRMSIADGFRIFSDQDRTVHMVAMNHGVQHTYDGYTEIVAVNSEYGNCNLTMRKG